MEQKLRGLEFKKDQQKQIEQQRIELQKYTEADVEEKKRRINAWIDRNKGFNLDELKYNIANMNKDVFALSEAFLGIYDILNYIFNLKTESILIKSYYHKINSLGFDVLELGRLVYEGQEPIDREDVKIDIYEMVKKDIPNMKFIINFIADDTKITQKKSLYEDFSEEE